MACAALVPLLLLPSSPSLVEGGWGGKEVVTPTERPMLVIPEGSIPRPVARPAPFGDIPSVDSCIRSPGFRRRDDKRVWRCKLEKAFRADEEEEEEEEEEERSDEEAPITELERQQLALQLLQMVKALNDGPSGIARLPAIRKVFRFILFTPRMKQFFAVSAPFHRIVINKVQEFLADPAAEPIWGLCRAVQKCYPL